MKVWIDLANSPHPLLFAPVARSLGDLGHTVAVTYRDHAQTAALARERWPKATQLGGPSPAGRVAKARAIGARVQALRDWARGHRPDVALSHNSYAQIIAARGLGIPAVTAMDYEHQPANHLAFRLARTVLLPDVVPENVVRRQGARPAKVTRYPGLKEELYLADFVPDEGILATLGIIRPPGGIVVIARSAPAGAVYHAEDNPLFLDSLRVLSSRGDAITVVLARHRGQREQARALGLPMVHVPEGVVDGRSLLCAADAFVGAGGTMSREAALLGVKAWSMFAGRRPAVDKWLEAQGMLRTLHHAEDLRAIGPRPDRRADLTRVAQAGNTIREAFVAAVTDYEPLK